MSSVEATIKTIIEAIPGVCGPDKGVIKRAKNFVQEKGEDISAILDGLNKICIGIFMSQAGLELDIPEDQVDIVDDILVRDGRKPPPGLSVRKKVGTTDLTTEATDLSRAVNELDDKTGVLSLLSTAEKSNLVGAINEIKLDGLEYLPVGTLGSFYSCTSLADTSPTLIATGKNTIAEMAREEQKCKNWAFSLFLVSTESPNSVDHPDYSQPTNIGNGDFDATGHIYGSFSSSGFCFSIGEKADSDDYPLRVGVSDASLICMNGLDR